MGQGVAADEADKESGALCCPRRTLEFLQVCVGRVPLRTLGGERWPRLGLGRFLLLLPCEGYMPDMLQGKLTRQDYCLGPSVSPLTQLSPRRSFRLVGLVGNREKHLSVFALLLWQAGPGTSPCCFSGMRDRSLRQCPHEACIPLNPA